jgi:hypothetical protein
LGVSYGGRKKWEQPMFTTILDYIDASRRRNNPVCIVYVSNDIWEEYFLPDHSAETLRKEREFKPPMQDVWKRTPAGYKGIFLGAYLCVCSGMGIVKFIHGVS